LKYWNFDWIIGIFSAVLDIVWNTGTLTGVLENLIHYWYTDWSIGTLTAVLEN
jgi:hypothetical protein